MVYWRVLLVNTTRTVPVMGLAVRREMALLNSESMGRRIGWLVDGLIVARGGGAPPLSIFEGGQGGNRFAVEGLRILRGEHSSRDAIRWGDQIEWGIRARVTGCPPQLAVIEIGALGVDCHFVLVGCLISVARGGRVSAPHIKPIWLGVRAVLIAGDADSGAPPNSGENEFAFTGSTAANSLEGISSGGELLGGGGGEVHWLIG